MKGTFFKIALCFCENVRVCASAPELDSSKITLGLRCFWEAQSKIDFPPSQSQ